MCENNNEMEELLDAIHLDNTEKVSEILGRIRTDEKSLNSDGNKDETSYLQDAFVQAAFSGSLKNLQALREFISDMNCLGRLRDWYPDCCITPLRAAVESDSVETVQWLCSNGADPNHRERVSSIYHPDITSCFSNHCSVSCYVPLHFARSGACVNILLKHGADINAQECMSKTPLSMATLTGRLDVMETLCKECAHVDLGSSWGATPLVYAQCGRRKKDRIAATEILCRHNADVNFQDRNGRSALHVAKDVESVQILLAYGADPSTETIFGKTAIITAAENELWSIVWILYDAEIRTNIGLLARGVSLFSCLPLDVLTWLVGASNDVRELTHLCRAVIRTQLFRKYSNIDEAIAYLPIPPRIKFYIGLWYHIEGNASLEDSKDNAADNTP